jgi:hypothetical protein
MRTSKLIISVVMGVLGVALIVRGAWGGVWPPSIQLMAGILLLAFAGLRWWMIK